MIGMFGMVKKMRGEEISIEKRRLRYGAVHIADWKQ
jgi:hypothetical protein